MMVYIVIQLRFGDMVSMHRMFTDKSKAFQYMSRAKDTETSWWKVAEFDSNVVVGREYDIVVRVSWEKSNRATIEEIYDHGYDIPQKYSGRHYFIETLFCE
jgi:hypothetical protein